MRWFLEYDLCVSCVDWNPKSLCHNPVLSRGKKSCETILISYSHGYSEWYAVTKDISIGVERNPPPPTR